MKIFWSPRAGSAPPSMLYKSIMFLLHHKGLDICIGIEPIHGYFADSRLPIWQTDNGSGARHRT